MKAEIAEQLLLFIFRLGGMELRLNTPIAKETYVMLVKKVRLRGKDKDESGRMTAETSVFSFHRL